LFFFQRGALAVPLVSRFEQGIFFQRVGFLAGARDDLIGGSLSAAQSAVAHSLISQPAEETAASKKGKGRTD